MQSFGQGRGCKVVVDWGGVIGRLAGSSGQVGGGCRNSGVAGSIIWPGLGHGLWAGGGGTVNGVMGRWLAYLFGKSGGHEGLVEVVEGLA